MSQQPFQVDLRGVVDLLSRHIYSSPQVYLRELLQNGRDAIAARRSTQHAAPPGQITVTVGNGRVRFEDNGIGLTQAEATDLLSTVGRSSKRDEVLGLRRDEFLGQFGIGLLSCFLVSSQIVVKSQSVSGGPPIKWVGSADGSYEVSPLDEPHPVGTSVELALRADDAQLTSPADIRALLAKYGEFLPDTITLVIEPPDGEPIREQINHSAPFIDGDERERLEYGHDLIGAEPLAVIPVAVAGTRTVGTAYVLPFSPPPNGRQSHRVYLGRMLLAERAPDLLPDWAFFVRCVVNTEGLTPTASRETIVENDALESTRVQLGQAVRDWIVALAAEDPHTFALFVAIHQLALKTMALYDDELAQVLLPHIVVQTSNGSISLGELTKHHEVRYCETVDEFRQVAAIVPEDKPIVNAGHSLESDLLRRLPQLFGDVSVRQVSVHEVLAALRDVDSPAALELAARAERAIPTADCAVTVREFEPSNIPAMYVADPQVLRRFERGQARDIASAMWASVLDQVDEIVNQDSEPTRPELCLNWSNQLVQELSRIEDGVVLDRSVRLLHVQALLAGHHPLRSSDRASLTSAMSDLIQLSVFRDQRD